MSIPKRKGDKAYITAGGYECVIDKNGMVINPSFPKWSTKGIQEYIEFLNQILQYVSQYKYDDD